MTIYPKEYSLDPKSIHLNDVSIVGGVTVCRGEILLNPHVLLRVAKLQAGVSLVTDIRWLAELRYTTHPLGERLGPMVFWHVRTPKKFRHFENWKLVQALFEYGKNLVAPAWLKELYKKEHSGLTLNYAPIS